MSPAQPLILNNIKKLTLPFIKEGRFFLGLLFICFLFPQDVSGKFDFNSNCQNAYHRIFSLRLTEARNLIENEKQINPTNDVPYFLDNYIDLFTILINQNKEEFKRLEKNRSDRFKRIDAGDKNSPYYLYTKGEMNLQWALARIKFEEYFTAVFEIRSALQLLEENQKKFPQFIPNQKTLGMLHVIMGLIPDEYKKGASLFGFEGSIPQGMRELKNAVKLSAEAKTFVFWDETIIYYTFLQLYVEDKGEEAWQLIQNSGFKPKESLVHTFIAAHVGMKSGHNNEAIKVLSERPAGSAYFHLPYLDYMLGVAKLNRLDKDADFYLHRFLDTYKGQNSIKDTYQKLSWYAAITNNTERYDYYRKKCLKEGIKISESDKQAEKEADEAKFPNVTLLKAKLLNNGGYYKEGIAILSGKSTIDFTSRKEKLDFSYRAGRIYDEWGFPDKAIPFYKATIANGAEESYYFAARAALQLGMIYDKKKDFVNAKHYYKMCTQMKNTEYKTALDGKAKAQLKKLPK